jgi:DNA-binding transcriptional ArsR family regulator
MPIDTAALYDLMCTLPGYVALPDRRRRLVRCGCGCHQGQSCTVEILAGHDGRGQLRPYSPLCRWWHEQFGGAAPDALDVLATLHGGSRADAARWLRGEPEPAPLAAGTLAPSSAPLDAELAATPNARAVLDALITLADEQGACHPSIAALAQTVGKSERTVQRALAWLEGRYIATYVVPNGPARRVLLAAPARATAGVTAHNKEARSDHAV